eukprot:Lithocolla_globosa_v1_NODE_515_length_3843_cov_39.657075.p1 type:complete len:404 gc:universal NODE_515_length_3843_cov_39.657075:3178-1967(-)
MMTSWRTRSATKWNEHSEKLDGGIDIAGCDQTNMDSVEMRQQLADSVIELLRREASCTEKNSPQGRADDFCNRTLKVLESIMDSTDSVPEDSLSNKIGSERNKSEMILNIPCSEIYQVHEKLKLDEVLSSTPVQIPVGHGNTVSESILTDGFVNNLNVNVDPNLNVKQNIVAVDVLTWLKADLKHTKFPSHYPYKEPLRIIVHGGPGVGKSTFARNLVKRANVEMYLVACTAPTGIAASNLPDGRTIYCLLTIPVNMKKDQSRDVVLEPLDPQSNKFINASLRLKNVRVIILDECSMVDSVTYYQIDCRLRQFKNPNLPFGGVTIILMGDYFQLPPVMGFASYKSALSEISRNPTLPSQIGTEQFIKFKLRSFTQQMRAAGDKKHTDNIEKLRDVSMYSTIRR